MTSQGRNRTVAGVLRFLAGHRSVMYLVGLAAIVSPTLLEKSGATVSPTARTLVVLASLALMAVTYVGERRFGRNRRPTEDGTADGTVEATAHDATSSSYSRRTRLAFAFALVGLAIGVYVAIEVSRLAGIAFVVGAYFFGYFAFEGGDDGN